MIQGRMEKEVGSLLLDNDKNNVIVDKVLFLVFKHQA